MILSEYFLCSRYSFKQLKTQQFHEVGGSQTARWQPTAKLYSSRRTGLFVEGWLYAGVIFQVDLPEPDKPFAAAARFNILTTTS